VDRGVSPMAHRPLTVIDASRGCKARPLTSETSAPRSSTWACLAHSMNLPGKLVGGGS
jgi:hypothetical protein